ncbi:hypothetical protein ABW19_dt0208591 [Dactylella cylindrospora]|nr:hypothetical protein ABW19_dt0208591 [Dactylella cylindrospora]
MQPDPRNVIVLGLTQNGKSSFIKSILEYEGAIDEGSPETGSGNMSQTKEVSIFSRKINIRTHIARRDGVRTDITHNSKGSRVTIIYDEDGNVVQQHDEPLKFREITEASTGETRTFVQDFETSIDELQFGLIPDELGPPDSVLNVNIYDTPGLSDSEGQKSAIDEYKKRGYTEAEAEKAASQSTFNPVDEKHRFRIIKSVKEMGTLHAVCLVVQNGKNFGPELGKLKYLAEVFKSMRLPLNYYIIHTMVTSTTMFEAGTLYRIPRSEEFFGIQAKHFFINNLPDRDPDFPLSAHFADRVLSDFMLDLKEAEGVNITEVPFRKIDRSIDEALNGSLNILLSQFQADERSLKRKIDELPLREEPSKLRIRLHREEIDKLNHRKWGLDTEEHIQLGEPIRRTAVIGLFGRNTVYFERHTNAPIQRVDYNPHEPGIAFWARPPIEEVRGTTRFYASLTGHPWPPFGACDGEVRLYGFKRDVERDQINYLNQQIVELEDMERKEKAKLQDLEAERQGYLSSLSSIAATVAATKEQIETHIKPDTMPIESLSRLGHYLLTNDVYTLALGYEFATKFPAKLLPKLTLDTAQILQSLEQDKAMHREKELESKQRVEALEPGVSSKMNLLSKLKLVGKMINSHLDNLELRKLDTKISESDLSTLSEIKIDLPDVEPEAQDFLRRVEERFRQQPTLTTEGSEDAILEEEDWYLNSLMETQDKIQVVASAASEGSKELDEWSEKYNFHSSTANAIDSTVPLVTASEYTLGEFTVLRLAMEKKQRETDAECPFVQLYKGIAYGIQCQNRATN